jgi:hypothetical protein
MDLLHDPEQLKKLESRQFITLILSNTRVPYGRLTLYREKAATNTTPT